MRGPFHADLQRFYRFDLETPTPNFGQRLRLYVTHTGFHCVAAYRFSKWAEAQGRRHPILLGWVSLQGRLLHHLINFLHHVDIAADIGPGFYIGHAGTIVIGPTRIGGCFSVTHNVTIGIGHPSSQRGLPVIGEGVWIGTGAVLSGPIQVGNKVTVASGTILSRDVPDECLVAGNPGRVVMSSYDNTKLVGTTAS